MQVTQAKETSFWRAAWREQGARHAPHCDGLDPLGSIHIFGGCARMTASLTAVPQPGPVGRRRSPFSITYGLVRSFAFHGTSSTSNSMIRKLGIAAQKCALMILASGPLKLCDATLTS